MRNKLIELLDEKQYHGNSTEIGINYIQNSTLADFLLDNGVIVLPCKVGDLVYTNINGIGLQNSFRVNSVDLLGFSNGLYSWTWHQLGKSVFLTLEDAQHALKGGEE